MTRRIGNIRRKPNGKYIAEIASHLRSNLSWYEGKYGKREYE